MQEHTHIGKVSLEKEIIELLVKEKLGRNMLLRRAIKDARGERIKCRCVSSSGEPSATCRRCLANGFIWKEHPIVAYSTIFGTREEFSMRQSVISPDSQTYYLISSQVPEKSDMIIRAKLAPSGKIKVPVERLKYQAIEAVEMLSELKGLTTFWKIVCHDRNIEELRSPGN